MVAGYVVMRVAMVFQWGRAARQDPGAARRLHDLHQGDPHRPGGLDRAAAGRDSVALTFACAAVLTLVEFAGPWIAETRKGGTPWHAHHIVERYGLLVIIALGEGLLGTIASLSVLVGPEGPGWTVDAALVAVAGIALTFGMWWIYFVVPCGEILHVRRERSFGWGYGHIPIIGAVVATGAGLHVAAYYLEEHSELGACGTVLSVVIPVAAYILGIFVLYTYLTRSFDGFHVVLLGLTALLCAAPVVLASAGASLAWCLAVLCLSPG